MYDAPVAWVIACRNRLESKSLQRGLVFPWWIAVVSAAAQIFCVTMGLAQRGVLLPPQLLALTIPLVLLPHLAQVLSRTWVPSWITGGCVLAATGWLLSEPLDVGGPADTAAVVVAFMTAEVTATDGARGGLVAVVASIALLLGMDRVDNVPGVEIYVLEVALGFVIGYMMRWQMRALAAERQASAGERERATLAERQRIARDIHDLVAHSLSVTLLHVTGARRALTEDRDVDEAIDALQDAERIGRQAMADIRRTVSVLATEAAGVQPLPGAADIEHLVEEFREAGLEVSQRRSGDLSVLTPVAGLGTYRIVQESLANVVKHAPRGPASVDLEVDSGGVRVVVRNRLPEPGVGSGTGGSGLSGIASRARQLGGTVTVGPRGDDWVVELVVPVEQAEQGGERASEDPGAGPTCVVRRIVT